MTDIPKAIETAKRLREFAAGVSSFSRGDLHYPHIGDMAFSFIAAARNDAPALCDAVEELANENERLRGVLRKARRDLADAVYGEGYQFNIPSIVCDLSRALAEKE